MPSNFRSYSGRHRLHLFLYIYLFLSLPRMSDIQSVSCRIFFSFFFTASGLLESIYQKLKHLIIFNLFITVLPHFIQNLYPRCVYPGITQYWAPTHMPHPHYALLSEETQMGSCDPAGCTPAKSRELRTFSQKFFWNAVRIRGARVAKNKVFKLNLIEITCVTFARHMLIPVTTARWETSGGFFFFFLTVFSDRPLGSRHWRRLSTRGT